MTPKAYSYVRFSTPEQAQGDSLRRQIEQSQEYAEQNGLELDDSLNLQDLGLSAFKGLHKAKGALGAFLRLVEQGNISRGSVLIVESLDRLSREQVLDALNQFTTIIRHGIRVVTLADNMAYDQESVNANFGQLLMSLVIMSRAYEESKIKSDRLKSVWRHKRSDWQTGNGQKVLTGKCPAWMRLNGSEDRTRFVLIPERCKAVELIYKKKLAGKGSLLIAKELNQREDIWKPPVTRKNVTGGWMKSYVVKILSNRACIGEFQPHKMIKNDETGKEKRTPSGNPISNYYPPAIDEDLFYQVQDLIRHNKETAGHAGGKTGKCNNLFAYIARCGYCGASMCFVGKGKPPSVARLVCNNARRGLSCKSVGWRYDEFEGDILKFLSFEIDVSKLLPGHEETQNEISLLQREGSSIQGQLSKVDREIENLSDTIASTPDKRVRQLLEGKLAGRLDEKERLQKSKLATDKKIDSLKRISVDMKERISNMKDLAAHMQRLKDKGSEEALIEIRLELRQALRSVIDEIKLFPSGFKDRAHVDELQSPDERDIYYEGINNKAFRFYQVNLKGCRQFSLGWYSPEAYQKLQELEAKRSEGCGFFPEFQID